jgi:hypothetical protein
MTTQTLEDFLKEKAAELNSDFIDVPQWVIKAANEYIDLQKPSLEEQAISLASHYLCDGDMSTKEMIEAIAAHEDQTDLIDNVDGVVVLDKVEWSFTCEDFLSEIGWDLV